MIILFSLSAQSGNRVTTFKFHSDFEMDLDEDEGWADNINIAPTQTMDTPFRVQFEIETDGTKYRWQYILQYRWNEGAWNYLSAKEFPYESQHSLVASIVKTNTLVTIYRQMDGYQPDSSNRQRRLVGTHTSIRPSGSDQRRRRFMDTRERAA